MSKHHADPGEVVDLASWTDDLPAEKTKVIVKTDKMELIRLVIPAGKEIPEHKVSGPTVVHCIQGRLKFTAMGTTQELNSGQLLYLASSEPHSLEGIEDAVVILTIIFKN